MNEPFYIHLATPPGEGGIAVIELYGASAGEALKACFRPMKGVLPGEGQARYGEFRDANGDLVDEVVLTRVPAAGMWSRVEAWTLSLHGGNWLQARAVQVLSALGGETRSTPGILRLAMESGAIDAIQARAYLHLLKALTPKAARFFLRQYAGELSSEIRLALDRLSLETLDDSLVVLAQLLGRGQIARRAAEPLRVLVAGRPNAGKSTLFNRLVEDERAVVSPVPGTTRDRLEECVVLDGYPIVLGDSAGLRPQEEASEVEKAGISRVRPEDWDAVLYLVPYPWRLEPGDRSFLERIEPDRHLILASLADRAAPGEDPSWENSGHLKIAALSGHGLDALRREMLARWISPGHDSSEEIPCGPFEARHNVILRSALESSGDSHAILDAARSAYIECLRSPWP